MRGRKTGGRKRGTPNRVNRDVRDMILAALHEAGGVDYLKARAMDSPALFLGLLAKILPKEPSADERDDPDAGKMVIEIIGGLPKQLPVSLNQNSTTQPPSTQPLAANSTTQTDPFADL